MRKRRLFTWLSACLLLTMLMALPGPVAVRADAGSVTNPDFELDNDVTPTPTGWITTGTAGASYTEWGGYSGNWRLSHWSADPYVVEASQTITGLARGWYTLRVWVRSGGGQNAAYIALKDCGSREAARTYLPVAPASQWLQIVVSTHVTRSHCTISLYSDANAGNWANFDAVEFGPGRSPTTLPVRGADISSLAKSEALGGVYRTETGHPQDALRILSRHGLNWARVRVWVDPADGYHTTAELLQMAKRIHRNNMNLLVDLHYSDTWADPGKQTKPAAWADYTVEELNQAIYAYTFSICQSLKQQRTPPDMVQIGNELNAGMLWPDGHTWNPPNWDNLALFLKSGYNAIKTCSPQTKVMLHLANGGNNGLYQWWFDNITSRGVPFDVIGVSYYSYWHGSLADLQYNLNDISARYNTDVIVVETAYPFTLADADGWENIINLEGELTTGYAATPAGQAAMLRDVMSIVRAVPNGRGLGIFWWDATWTGVPGNGWDPADPASGNAWENQALFDFDDRPLPAMNEFKP